MTYNPKGYLGFDSNGKFKRSGWLYEPEKDYYARESSRPEFSGLILDLNDEKFVTYTWFSLSYKKGISSAEVGRKYQKKLISSLKKILAFPADKLNERDREGFKEYAKVLFEVPCNNPVIQELKDKMLERGIVSVASISVANQPANEEPQQGRTPIPVCKPQNRIATDPQTNYRE